LTPNDNTGNQVLEVIAEANKFNHWMYQTIKPFLHGEILEIGSGIGNISKFFILNRIDITLSDTDYYYIKILKLNYDHHTCVKDIMHIDLQLHNFQVEYSHLKNKFDTIFLLNVLEHIEWENYAL
jgi:2-polyprenyl-3-methyl-5-hydroxy-6-metoxy-1,4-benzoquinol methylase